MCPQRGRFVAAAVASLSLCAAAPAQAREVLVVDGPRTAVVDDPFVPARTGADLGREPHAAGAASPAVAAAAPRSRGRHAVVRALLSARRGGAITGAATAAGPARTRWRASATAGCAGRGARSWAA